MMPVSASGFDDFADGLHQRVNAESQGKIEHDGAVFDQQIGIAGAAVGDARRVGCRQR